MSYLEVIAVFKKKLLFTLHELECSAVHVQSFSAVHVHCLSVLCVQHC